MGRKNKSSAENLARVRAYHEKHKNDPSYKARKKEISKRCYQKCMTNGQRDVIYVAASNFRPDHLKIGRTNNPYKRLRHYKATDHTMHFIAEFPCSTPKVMEERVLKLLEFYYDVVDGTKEWFEVEPEGREEFVFLIKTLVTVFS